MAFKPVILDGAYNDLDNAVAWYAQFSQKLSGDLLLQFENAVQQLTENPLQYQLQKGQLQENKSQTDEILIVAFAHQKRKQLYWRNR